MPPALIVERGTRYGALTVIREFPKIDGWLRCFECRCDCGNVKAIRLYNLSSGNSMSCGCLKNRSGSANPNFRHGMAGHPLYWVWNNAKQRCIDKDDANYKNYGARGIAMCAEWIDDPYAFIAWGLANGYEPGLYLDREDNDGNYTPSNCRFVTAKVSANNQRRRTAT
jgi:hypothetical protein